MSRATNINWPESAQRDYDEEQRRLETMENSHDTPDEDSAEIEEEDGQPEQESGGDAET